MGLFVAAGVAEARDQIRIVGSSTVYPFSTAVAETFGKTTKFKTPVVESTGSGGGLKLFCAGIGTSSIRTSRTRRAGSKRARSSAAPRTASPEVTEVKVGYDGIVLANSKEITAA